MSELVSPEAGDRLNGSGLRRWAPVTVPLGLAVGSVAALMGLITSSSRADDPVLLRTECDVVATAAASLSPDEKAGAAVILTRIGDPAGSLRFKPNDLPSRVNREVIDCAATMAPAAGLSTPTAPAAGLVAPIRFGRVALAKDGASAQVVVRLPDSGRLLTLERRGGEWARSASQELWRE